MGRAEGLRTCASSKKDICTTKFLELLLRFGYVNHPEGEKALTLNLPEETKTQFLKECSEFLRHIDETEASKLIVYLRKLYFQEVSRLESSPKNTNESKFSWFSLAKQLFSRASISVTGKTSPPRSLENATTSPTKKFRTESPVIEDATISELNALYEKTNALKEIRDASKNTEVVLVKMDVTKADEIAVARKVVESKVGDKGLNLLINNAGVLKIQGFAEITEENMMLHFSTNAMGPVMVLKEMLPLLQKASAQKGSGMNISRAAVLNISSAGASHTLLPSHLPKDAKTASKPGITSWPSMIMGYRTSKAALNMAMRVIADTVKNQGILVVNMAPGWVKTDMGTDQGLLTLFESISTMLKTMPHLNESHHGTFLDRYGNIIPY